MDSTTFTGCAGLTDYNMTSQHKYIDIIWGIDYLSSDSGPHFQGGIVTTAQDTVAVELQASDDVIIMASHHDGRVDRLVEPVVLDEILAHVRRLPGALAAW